MVEAARLDAQNPWPGLASFTEADRAFFRGREAEAEELARLVRRERLTVLFGRSGLGKSSLLNAGLFPRLREDLHLPVVVRVGYGAALSPRQQVWDALAAACAEAAVEAPPPEAHESMWAFFHRAGGGFWNLRRRPVLPVLVFDQFEELFTLGQADEPSRAAAQGFLEELADLVEDRPSEALRRALDADPARGETLDFDRRGCKVVLSFREDFLAEVEGLRRRMPSLMRNRYRLLPMDGAQARAVIASGGSLVGPEVAERIVGLAWRNRAEAPAPEEAGEIEVDPALLSVICSELNLRRRRAGGATIEPALLAGAETEILADFYERSLQGLDPGVRQFVEDELITTAGYRDSFAFDDAIARPGVTREALQGLVNGRLLRLDERFGVRRLELTHDVLTRVVKESRDARRAREAEAAAVAHEREAALRQQRARRRERAVWAGGVVATALLIGAIWAGNWAIRRDKEATEIEEKARIQGEVAKAALAKLTAASKAAELRAEELAASAAVASAQAQQARTVAEAASEAARAQTTRANATERNALATDLIVAARSAPAAQLQLLLGAEAVRRYPERLDGQVELLARLVGAHRVRRIIDFDAPIVASAATADGALVLLGTARGQLALIDARSGRVVGRWTLDTSVVQTGVHSLRLEPSADARLALIDVNHTPYLVRLVPGQPLQAQPVGRYGTGREMILSSDGRQLADAATPQTVQIHTVIDGAPAPGPRRVALPRSGGVRCMSFAVPGRLLIGTDSETWSIEPGDGRVERLALRARPIARSPDCTKALVLEVASDGGPRYSLLDVRAGAEGSVLKELLATQPRTMIGQPSFVAGGAFVAARFADEFELWPLAGGPALGWQAAQSPRRVAASADGRWLGVRLADGAVELRRLVEPEFTARIELPQPPSAMHFAADGSALLAVGEGHLVQIVGLENDRALKVRQTAFRAGEIEFSVGGSHLGAGGLRGEDGLAMWDAKSGKHLTIDPSFTRIEFSPDGALMAAEDRREPRVRVFDLPAGVRLKADIALPDETSVSALAFDARGRRLAIAVKGAIVIRDLHDPSFRTRIPLGESPARKLAFYPREPAVVAAVLADGGVRAFGVLDRGERWHMRPVAGRVEEDAVSVAYSPHGEWLVVGRRDGAVALHDPRSGALRLPLAPPRTVAEPAKDLVFIEGTSILSAGALDSEKDFWDVAARRWLGLVGSGSGRNSGEGDLKGVAISSRGRRFALKHADDTLSLHGWDPATLVRDACAIAGRNLTCTEWRRFMREEGYRKTCETLPPPEPACGAGSR